MRHAVWLVILLASAAHSQPTPAGEKEAARVREAYAAASEALPTLQKLVRPDNAAAMGFRSAEEASEVTLGPPIPVFMVQLDELRRYSPDQDPNALLHPLDKVVVPGAVGGDVRTSIVMEKVGERWTATGFGSPKLASLLSEARDSSARNAGIAIGDCFAVHVAALNTYYIGYRTGGTLMLTAVIADPTLDLRPGQSVRAAEAFAKLAARAGEYNGLPL